MKATCLICNEVIETRPTYTPKRRRDRQRKSDESGGREVQAMLTLMTEHLVNQHPEEAEESEESGILLTGVLVADHFESNNSKFNDALEESTGELLAVIDDLVGDEEESSEKVDESTSKDNVEQEIIDVEPIEPQK